MSVEGERELEEFLAGALSGNPSEETPPEPPPEGEVVHDERPGFQPPPEDDTPTPPPSPEPVEEVVPGEEEIPEGEEGEEGREEGDRNVVWATKKYGKDPTAWAKAAFEQEQHISRLASAKDEAEAVAREAIQYAQQVEASTQQATAMGMPLSAQEEAWIEQNMVNPAAAAYQAARAGNVALYNGVLEMVAAENPSVAVQIGTQVQMALQDEARQAQAAEAARTNGAMQQADFPTDLGQSFQRVGVDVQKYGPAMWQKVEELGEYHQYTLAILGGNPIERDLAVRAVYDLVRQGETTTRKVVDEQREAQIQREGELRRNAASVVTGSPHVAPVKQSPLLEAMEQEWRRRGQWHDEE